MEALARYGSAARGDPLYEALVQLGQLLRTVFLADYFVNEKFRRELLRVLNRGESVNALKRAIYTGRVANFQAKRNEELAAVGDALGLLANLVMAWNTAQMQAAFDRLNARKSAAVPPELIGRIAPTRTEGINLRSGACSDSPSKPMPSAYFPARPEKCYSGGLRLPPTLQPGKMTRKSRDPNTDRREKRMAIEHVVSLIRSGGNPCSRHFVARGQRRSCRTLKPPQSSQTHKCLIR